MGQSIQKDYQYGEFIGTAKPNETRVLRHPSVGDKPLPYIWYSLESFWEQREEISK